MSLSVNGINGNTNINNTQNVDKKEKAVADKLGISYEDWMKLSEAEKQAKVQAYNETHPNDQIEDKKYANQQLQGNEMSQFMKDVDWKKVKLQ